LEPWEKVLVNFEKFSQDVHGKQACITCHKGVQSADKETAHKGMIARPSQDAQATCGKCHPDITRHFVNSLHTTQAGYFTNLHARSEEKAHEDLNTMFGNHCATCHTSCGDCHISQPAGVGGGLFNGHLLERNPPMTRSCTACHGSRVGNEYLGKNEELPGDVHFRQGRMNCVACHDSHELHGMPDTCTECHKEPKSEKAMPPDHRYAGLQLPSCESCHSSVTTGKDGNAMHSAHGSDLSCQVCHSITYTSCDNCHVAISQSSGKPFFETKNTYFTFLIGRNPNPTYTRPYKYIPVRHIPIAPDSFSFYGDNLLPNFNNLPTWAYATPHNIQTQTPQAKECNSCHGNPAVFLTADKVTPEELEANKKVIVEVVPAEIITGTQGLTATLPISGMQIITGTLPVSGTLVTPPAP
jgi:thiosulfate/3-mercaptopyruvate sulfurtransferase